MGSSSAKFNKDVALYPSDSLLKLREKHKVRKYKAVIDEGGNKRVEACGYREAGTQGAHHTGN